MQVDSELGPLQDWIVTGIIFSIMENHLLSKEVPQKQPSYQKENNKVNTFCLISSPKLSMWHKIKLLQSLERCADASHIFEARNNTFFNKIRVYKSPFLKKMPFWPIIKTLVDTVSFFFVCPKFWMWHKN